MGSFSERVARNLDGCSAFSVGACPGCAECGLDSDSLPLVGASIEREGLPSMPVGRAYDDRGSEVYVYWETMGPVGIVRADSFESAWEVVVDAIMGDGDPEDPYTYVDEKLPADGGSGELCEGFHWRPSGVPKDNGLRSPVASEDPNGGMLLRVDVDPRDVERGTVDVPGFGRLAVALDRGEMESTRQCADEGGFSWAGCDSCGSSLGGNLSPAHYIGDAGEIVHCSVCVDCMMYHANGDLPEGEE